MPAVSSQPAAPPVPLNIPATELTIGRRVKVSLVWVTNPLDFWCQMLGADQDLEKLTFQLNGCYEKMSPADNLVSLFLNLDTPDRHFHVEMEE